MWNDPWYMKIIITYSFCCSDLWKSNCGCGKAWKTLRIYISYFVATHMPSVLMPAVLWHCWLGSRKGIQPVKTGEVLAWLSVWSKVQMICKWSSWCHCHPIISCSTKIQNGLPFWYQFTQVVLEKRPLNSVSSSVRLVISTVVIWEFICIYGDGAGNTVEENSSIFSLIECTSCLQCFDTVSWVAGRASGP